MPFDYLHSFLLEGAHHLLHNPFSAASAVVRMCWPLAAGQFMLPLDCVNWSQPVLEAVQRVGAACEKTDPGLPASCMTDLHRMVVAFAEWLPLMLAQWVAAAAPGPHLHPACTPCVLSLLSELREVLSASGAGDGGIVERLAQNLCPAVGEDKAADGDDGGCHLAEQALGGPRSLDAAAGCVGGVRFQALWAWSTAACARLVGKLRAVCMAGAVCSTNCDSGSPVQVQAQVDVEAAIAIVQLADCSSISGASGR